MREELGREGRLLGFRYRSICERNGGREGIRKRGWKDKNRDDRENERERVEKDK